jgi:hypothetical protein
MFRLELLCTAIRFHPMPFGLKGTYIAVEPFHLFRYLDEQVFRYNFRELPHDGARFEHVASHVLGKRLTYAEVTGKVGETTN